MSLAFEAGVRPFDPLPAEMPAQRDLGELAASLVQGRSTYFDRENRRVYGTRVHHLHVTAHRLVLCAVESALPVGEKERVYRASILRCDGELLYQSDTNRSLDLNAAMVDMRYNLQRMNEDTILMTLCERQVRVATRMKDNAERVMMALMKHGPPPKQDFVPTVR